MAYKFNKFKAIESDKENLDHKNKKTALANSIYGGDEINPILQQIASGDREVEWIDLNLIKPRGVNDFDNTSLFSLKESIRNVGMFFPILVRQMDDGKYIIISGHRRVAAIKELLSEYRIKKAEAENKNASAIEINEIEKRIEQFSKVKATVFVVVDTDSERLGTDLKYITKEQEEQIYIASNAESRGNVLEGKSGYVIIEYFYKMVKADKAIQTRLLEQQNEGANRKATKLNIPKMISVLVVDDLGYKVSTTYVWRIVTLIETADQYPKYHKRVVERLKNSESVRDVFNDYQMAVKIHKEKFESKDEEQEYATRIEKGDEKIVDIFNEYYNIRPVEKKKSAKIDKDKVIKLLQDVMNNKISVEEALKEVKKAN